MLRLLDKLAHDDLFRIRFERQPRSVLLEAGFSAADVYSDAVWQKTGELLPFLKPA